MSPQIHYIILVSAILILISSLFIKRIHHSFLSEPVLVMLIGFMVNLMNIEVFQVDHVHRLMNDFSRVVIIVAITTTALRIRHVFILKNKRNLSIAVFAGMIGMWLVSSLIIHLIFSSDLLFSLMAGAMITPTDPVVATSMVSGKLAEKFLPEKIRFTLSFEAGANDGLAFPMVMLPFLLIEHPAGKALQEFFLKTLLWENIAAILLAGLAGYSMGWIYHTSHKKGLMDKESVIGYSLALTFAIYSLFEVIHTNSIVSVFAAGILFNSVISANENIREEALQEVVERMLVVPVFFIFGLVAPWQQWSSYGLGLLTVFAFLILLFRRLPVFLVLKPFLKGFSLKDILLMGWFGPIGVAAIFYVTYIYEKHPFPHLWTIVSFMIFSSTIVHGFTRYYTSRSYYKSKKDNTPK